MQTFLPYRDFARTARVLDDRRLGKQRVEALQIIRALTWPAYGWKHHPAVKMWRGHEEALGAYGLVICAEWRARGHADTCEASILRDLAAADVRTPPRSQAELDAAGELPPWLGRRAFHAGHKATLLRKDPDHYRARLGRVDEGAPVVWPVAG